MRVALVQMCSTDDLAANLKAAAGFVDEAAERGAAFVLLPEMFAYLRREGQAFPHAQGLDGEIVTSLREWARRHRIRLLGGSFAERIDGEERVFNTSVLIDPQGEVEAVYRKIHLFDVQLGPGGNFRESASIAPGSDVVVAETPIGGIGLSVCYDLRFPELYREMAARADVRFICAPSAFAPQTGKDHWEVLLRARAIENQAFVLAPAQCGTHGPKRSSHGRSLAVDPWGLVLAQAGDAPGVVTADCDRELLERIRGKIPALQHRRL
ncbi:MAG: carbon-nitrogen hydrolase family protein [Deltaproteobacteria bacterium]|nr:carbon-nitrogen hydrolase family protein [Deltaproteobacteria bacterium]MBW2362961.1 carbon-nitrogen hydrolase family protein [Deltaproteobacteria bacterium]